MFSVRNCFKQWLELCYDDKFSLWHFKDRKTIQWNEMKQTKKHDDNWNVQWSSPLFSRYCGHLNNLHCVGHHMTKADQRHAFSAEEEDTFSLHLWWMICFSLAVCFHCGVCRVCALKLQLHKAKLAVECRRKVHVWYVWTQRLRKRKREEEALLCAHMSCRSMCSNLIWRWNNSPFKTLPVPTRHLQDDTHRDTTVLTLQLWHDISNIFWKWIQTHTPPY